MNPYLLLATAVVLVGIAIWYRSRSGARGETGSWFLLWLLSGAFATVFSSVSWWTGDNTISLSFYQVNSVFAVAGAFFVFAFARSFSRGVDYALFFWSLPMHLAVAAILVNGGNMFRREGSLWVFNGASPATWINAGALMLYAALSIAYIVLLLKDLRREGKGREEQRVKVVLAALLILFYAEAMEGVLGARSWFGAHVPLVEITELAGALVLAGAVAGRRWSGAREAQEGWETRAGG